MDGAADALRAGGCRRLVAWRFERPPADAEALFFAPRTAPARCWSARPGPSGRRARGTKRRSRPRPSTSVGGPCSCASSSTRAPRRRPASCSGAPGRSTALCARGCRRDRPPARPDSPRPGGRRPRSLGGPCRPGPLWPRPLPRPRPGPRSARLARGRRAGAAPPRRGARRRSRLEGPRGRRGAGRDGAVREAGRDGPGQAEHGLGPHARAGREHGPAGRGRGRAPLPRRREPGG